MKQRHKELEAINTAEKIFVAPEVAADMLGLGVDIVKEHCRTHYEDFPAVKRGAHWKVHVELLKEWSRRMTLEGKSL